MPGAAKYLLLLICLKTLAVDRCHMKHRLFQFVLLLLVARDGHLAGLPIAMAFVPVENFHNYVWFFRCCKEGFGDYLDSA
eukprot:3652660-Rhodomonas_salina.1